MMYPDWQWAVIIKKQEQSWADIVMILLYRCTHTVTAQY